MVQKQIEEKLEVFDQEISNIRVELHKLPMIEENLVSLVKSIERLEFRVEKLMKSTVGEGLSNRTSTTESTIEGGGMMMKEIKNEGKANEFKGDENSSDCNKFKKVEMLVCSGTNSDFWLFRVDQHFHIHKLTDSKKLTVAMISFEGAALD